VLHHGPQGAHVLTQRPGDGVGGIGRGEPAHHDQRVGHVLPIAFRELSIFEQDRVDGDDLGPVILGVERVALEVADSGFSGRLGENHQPRHDGDGGSSH